MYYYRIMNDDIIDAHISSSGEIIDDSYIPITQDEFEEVLEQGRILCEQAEAEFAQAEQTKDERIAELEQENAALLYQVLTGEVFADV